jgi:hypothetical protein
VGNELAIALFLALRTPPAKGRVHGYTGSPDTVVRLGWPR